MEKLFRKAHRLVTIRDRDDEMDEGESEERENHKHSSCEKSKHHRSKSKRHRKKHKSHHSQRKDDEYSDDGKQRTKTDKEKKTKRKEFDVKEREFSEDFLKEEELKVQQYFKKDSKIIEMANKWVDTTLDKGVDGLKKDFESLKRFVPDPFETTVFETNNTTGRNRYRDLPCLDQTRVILADDMENNYIHANYVKMALMEPRIICTQAPLDGTVNNFYQMILQEGVRAIIMLCNFTESGRKICTEYYPLNEGDAPLVFGDITVVCLHTSDMPGESKVHITWLGLKSKSGKRQTIRHIQWKDWPEHGVPEVSLTPMNILTAVRGSRGPVLVHCIDGVSRTGTIVAIEFILEKMLRGDANDDSSAMIKELRKQRALAIRTAMQYVYIHRELLQYLQERQITEMSQRLLEFVDDYDRFYKQYAKENATPPFTTNNPNEGDDAKTACFGQFNTADYFNVPKSTYLDSKTQISPSDPE